MSNGDHFNPNHTIFPTNHPTTLFFIGCQQEQKIEQKNEDSISISDTWIRPGVKDRNTAAFMKIYNNTGMDDTLLTASSSLAKVVEIHETFTKENDMKGMRQVDFVEIPNNSVKELKPNGLHIMLIGLEKNLASGDSGKINLNFKSAGEIIINTKVR